MSRIEFTFKVHDDSTYVVVLDRVLDVGMIVGRTASIHPPRRSLLSDAVIHSTVVALSDLLPRLHDTVSASLSPWSTTAPERCANPAAPSPEPWLKLGTFKLETTETKVTAHIVCPLSLCILFPNIVHRFLALPSN